MRNAAAFKATYSDWKLIRTRKVVQIVMEIPLEAENEAYAVLGGMPNPAEETWFAIARLTRAKDMILQPTERQVMPADADNNATVDTKPASVKPPVRAPRITLAQRAGILSKEPFFHRYVEVIDKLAPIDEQLAANFIRNVCKVTSRSQIVLNTPTGDKFLDLIDDYLKWRNADAYVETT